MVFIYYQEQIFKGGDQFFIALLLTTRKETERDDLLN